MDVFGSTQGAVDSLLGTLASLIKDEARLLGKVRGDVQFISDEMESMNGFLLHVDEATEEDDHQVRAWMKQVRDVAVESERWVDRYLQWEGTTPRGGGLLGFVRRIPHSLGTVSERHKIATKIQELKSRAHQVGERRQRYGVEVPSKKDRKVQDVRSRLGREDETEEQYAWRRCLEALLGEDRREHDMTEEDTKNIIRRLKEDKDMDVSFPHIIPVAGLSDNGINSLRTKVFQDSSVATHFHSKLWTTISDIWDRGIEKIIGDQLLSDLESQPDAPATGDEKYLRLKGKKFFIVLETSNSYWSHDGSCIGQIGWLDGSVIIVILGRIYDYLGYEYLDFTKPFKIQVNRAIALVEKKSTEKAQVLTSIIEKLEKGPNCLQMLFRILHVNPNRSLEKLQFLSDSLKWINGYTSRRRPDVSPHDAYELLLFSYKDLPNDSKRCLLYLSIVPPDCRIRRTCLVRRWVAEGLITRRAGMSALDAADRCFGALVDEGLLQCIESGVAGKVKVIVVPPAVLELNMQAAIAQDFEGLNLPPYLGLYLSVGGGLQLNSAPKVLGRRDSCSEFLRRSIICNCKGEISLAAEDDDPPDPVVDLLALLPRFERNGLLKVLDLADVKGLGNKQIMKNICQVSELRYLNLRGTKVTELPKDIDKMQNLETLDIRQTKVKVLPQKAIFLRKLKHMLSGNIEKPTEAEAGKSVQKIKETTEAGNYLGLGFDESFSAVGMPHGTGDMTAMEILSHVEVSCESDRLVHDFNQLISNFERLQKLRKFGVVFNGGTLTHVRSLLREIGKLEKSLRSLSIHFKTTAPDKDDIADSRNMITLPRLLESIKLSGLPDGLPSWVLKLSRLVKVTLQDIFLKKNDLQGLANLASLCGLRLRFVKYGAEQNETNLHIQKDEFQNLKNVLLEHTNITDLSFEEGAAPKLKKMHWNSNKVNSISGMEYLKQVNEIGFLDCTVHPSVHDAIQGNSDFYVPRYRKYEINFYDRVTRDGVPQDRDMVSAEVTAE